MSKRKPLIAANWKMYKTAAEAKAFVKAFAPLVQGNTRDEIVLCPPFLCVPTVVEAVQGTDIHVGGQNMHWQDDGAFTGETSAPMLRAAGCTFVILGHSERRQFFDETDDTVNQKLHAALKHKLTPIVCVGELLAEREGGLTEEVLLRQTSRALVNIAPEAARQIVIAYEPVWAIGTGKTATAELAAEAHLIIRGQVARTLGREIADNMRILYGGSVKPENAASLLNQPEIDGALVGGASLDPQSFAKIVNYTGF
ncbi:MAG TPA: triose-phosphate isomerase [Acidobacteriaceae bacterium]|jgi:triosephosphate isomerase|nr:triose-phosphate isomerase [Acidobacteriaceae bacterium]